MFKKKQLEAVAAQPAMTADPVITAESFTQLGTDAEKSEAIVRPSMSFVQDAMRRLAKNKIAIGCAVILIFMILGSIIFPFLSPYTMSEQHIDHAYKNMFYTHAEDGHLHIFGTDSLGRDIWVRIWEGARTSLFIAFAAVAINVVVGVLYGGISGYFGGMIDNILMRIVEIINGIPYLIIVILLMTVMEQGVGTIIIAYATVGWTGMARLVRGQIISLKEQEYVVAARAMGARPMRILIRHLLPNTLSVVIVNITLAIPSVIFTEAFLSFIGIGVPIPHASWGMLANEGVRVFQQYPYMLFIPAIFISLTMLSFNLFGDALRDVFDPRLRK